MKIPIPKKTILIFLASFAVINVAMYFFLNATQPKSAVPALVTQVAVSDSVAHSTTPTVAQPAPATPEVKKDTIKSQPVSPVLAAPDTTTPAPIEEPDMRQAAAVEVNEPEVPITETNKVPEFTAESEEPAEPDTEAVSQEETVPEEQAMDASDKPAESDPRQLQRLAKLLESMKPQQAAPIMSRLSDETIVALFMHMHERPAAKIMALLPVEQAARVSFLMSGMVASG